jgi:hypothetical protein
MHQPKRKVMTRRAALDLEVLQKWKELIPKSLPKEQSLIMAKLLENQEQYMKEQEDNE